VTTGLIVLGDLSTVKVTSTDLTTWSKA